MPGRRANDSTRAPSRRNRRRARAERGAILVQTAIMMVGLTAFSAFIVDYGILWTARRQVQNAADAAALAAAISLGFDAPGDQARAQQNALVAAAANPVWGLTPDVGAGDISFPACPTGAVPASGGGVCVRVDVFRNQRSSKALPTVFAHLFNVTDQGVRATATAQVLYGSSTDCVKPFAIPDRWQELRGDVGPAGWDTLDTFERYQRSPPPPPPVLLPGLVDAYVPRSGSSNGTGFSRGPSAFTAGDYGMQLEFEPGPVVGRAGAERFLPVVVTPGAPYSTDIQTCSSRVVQPGDTLETVSSNVGPETASGVLNLIAQDPAAAWSPSMNGGLGGVSGGCMATGACTVSPRIVALPVFDPDAWDAAPPNTDTVVVSRVVGFFIQRLEGTGIVGRLMVYPSAPRSTMTSDPQSAFVVSAALVR